MSKPGIVLASDHNGFELKNKIGIYLQGLGYVVEDAGDATQDPNDDFPVFASRAVVAVLAHPDKVAILVCGSGQGMMMAANRYKGIRAGLGWSVAAARSVREDEDSNVLALPAEAFASESEWRAVIDTWLSTPFAGAARYIRRNQMLDQLSHQQQ